MAPQLLPPPLSSPFAWAPVCLASLYSVSVLRPQRPLLSVPSLQFLTIPSFLDFLCLSGFFASQTLSPQLVHVAIHVCGCACMCVFMLYLVCDCVSCMYAFCVCVCVCGAASVFKAISLCIHAWYFSMCGCVHGMHLFLWLCVMHVYIVCV